MGGRANKGSGCLQGRVLVAHVLVGVGGGNAPSISRTAVVTVSMAPVGDTVIRVLCGTT